MYIQKDLSFKKLEVKVDVQKGGLKFRESGNASFIQCTFPNPNDVCFRIIVTSHIVWMKTCLMTF